jgi:uncharacterized protein
MHHSKHSLYLFAVAVCLVAGLGCNARADELKRRAFLGVQVAPLSDADRTRLGVAQVTGVRVAGVLPNGASEKAGVKADDVVLSINGTDVTATAQFVDVARTLKVGDRVELAIIRGGKRQTIAMTLAPTNENPPDFDVVYDSITVDNTKRRVIVTKPRTQGKHPAVLLVGGIGCYSLDNPFDNTDAYKKILYHLTRNGYVTMRVEKSGIGDSEGTPCPQVDFDAEVRGYVEGLRALAASSDVDAQNLFIFGHSIGGIAGPIVASKVPVRGIIASETVGTSWFEYELENTRRQLRLAGMDYDQIDAEVRVKERVLHKLLVEKQSPEQILKEMPEAAQHIHYPAHYTYLQQVAAQNMPALWKALDTNVLLIYGAADFVTSADEHKYIAEVVNSAHPGKAAYVEIPDLDHYLVKRSSQEDSFRSTLQHQPGEFNERINAEILGWLQRSTKRAA